MSEDHRRFDELFDRYYRPLVKTLMTFGREEEDARDLAQETFVQLWPRLDDVSPGAEWSYLKTAALRRAMNQARDRKALKRGNEVAMASIDFRASDRAASAETVMINTQQRERFRESFNAALDELPPESQQCVALRRQGLSYVEIAQRLGVEMTAVQSRLHRVTRHLRARVDEPPQDLDWLEWGGDE
jgi:RNA polymerase sigma factor (sigma-70 family)